MSIARPNAASLIAGGASVIRKVIYLYVISALSIDNLGFGWMDMAVYK